MKVISGQTKETSKSNHISDLPSDIKQSIFNNLDKESISNLSLVNKEFFSQLFTKNLNKSELYLSTSQVVFLREKSKDKNFIAKYIKNPHRIINQQILKVYLYGNLILNPSLINKYKLPGNPELYYLLLIADFENYKVFEHIVFVLYYAFNKYNNIEGLKFIKKILSDSVIKTFNNLKFSDSQNFNSIFNILSNYINSELFSQFSIEEITEYIYYSKIENKNKLVYIFLETFKEKLSSSEVGHIIKWNINQLKSDKTETDKYNWLIFDSLASRISKQLVYLEYKGLNIDSNKNTMQKIKVSIKNKLKDEESILDYTKVKIIFFLQSKLEPVQKDEINQSMLGYFKKKLSRNIAILDIDSNLIKRYLKFATISRKNN